MIYFLQSIKTRHFNYGEQIELLFSCEEKPPAAEQELEALRDIQREVDVDCTTAINFSPTQQSLKIRASFLT